MAAFSSIIGAIGLGLSAVGTFVGMQGAKEQAAQQAKAFELQAEAEKQREKQMRLEATRKRREVVRQAIQARSMAVATTTAQGASGGSALAGAQAGITNREGTNLLAINQNEQIGANLFSINRQIHGAYRSAADAGSQVSLGSGLSSLGGALMKADGMFGRLSGGGGFGGGYSAPQ